MAIHGMPPTIPASLGGVQSASKLDAARPFGAKSGPVATDAFRKAEGAARETLMAFLRARGEEDQYGELTRL